MLMLIGFRSCCLLGYFAGLYLFQRVGPFCEVSPVSHTDLLGFQPFLSPVRFYSNLDRPSLPSVFQSEL